jgi:hypothetical protein
MRPKSVRMVARGVLSTVQRIGSPSSRTSSLRWCSRAATKKKRRQRAPVTHRLTAMIGRARVFLYIPRCVLIAHFTEHCILRRGGLTIFSTDEIDMIS